MPVIDQTIAVDTTTILRPVQMDDAEALFAVVDANRVMLRQWLPWLDHNRTSDDTRTFLGSVIEQNAAGRGAVLAIFSDGQLCGVVGFNWIVPANRSGEIGYWLAASHQRRGIMSASVSALTFFAFAELKLHRVSITAVVENRQSRAIPERLGFQFEGVMRNVEWLYDRFVDHALYARLSTDL